MLMASTVPLACGPELASFQVPEYAQVLSVQDPEIEIEPQLFKCRLNAYLEHAGLDLRRAAVVVADKTRLCGYPQYLPILLEALALHGAPPERITIYIAYGTHARQSREACRTCYGQSYDRYRWIHHQCDQKQDFKTLGRTGRGTPVRMRTDVLDASCLITFGAIAHHYFAGFGGGRKLIFPGLGEKESIYANHGLFLDRQARTLATGCRPGLLYGNPLAEDLADYELYRQADMAVHGLLDSHGRVCDLLVGAGSEHFRNACARHAAFFEEDGAGQFDLVLASCGGYPKDINFIQSHKAIHNAAAFVRDGGRMIMLAQCRDGIGSETFLPWFELGGWDSVFERLAGHYVGNGGTALAMMAKLQRIRIALLTDMDPSLIRRIGCQHMTIEQVRRRVRQHTGSLAVIPNAGMLVKKPTGRAMAHDTPS